MLGDAWLVDNSHPFVTSTHPALVDQHVSSLMRIGVKEWDMEVIRDLFDDRDQLLICGIPLSPRHEEDTHFWSKERSGFYSVKSAFNLLQELKGNWVTNDNSGLWWNLWNLKIPPKVKKNLWRACNDFLPTKVALNRKRVPILTQCPTCNSTEESTLHCLVQCDFAQACSRVLGWIEM